MKREFEIGKKIQLGNVSLIVEERSYEYDCHNCFFYKLCRYECYCQELEDNYALPNSEDAKKIGMKIKEFVSNVEE